MRLFYTAVIFVLLVGLAFFVWQWRAFQHQESVSQRATLLIQQFDSQDAKQRAAVRDELASMGQAAVQPLVEALQEEKATVWQGAAETLGKIGEPAIEPLATALKDKEFKGRGRAAFVLGLIGAQTEHPRAVSALISVLDDNAVRAMLKRWDRRTPEERAVHALPEFKEAMYQNVETNAAMALIRIGKPALKPLVAVLDNTNYSEGRKTREVQMRCWAATILGALGDVRTPSSSRTLRNKVTRSDRQLIFETLERALGDREEAVRFNAANGMGATHDPRYIPVLSAALSDAKSSVRKATVDALSDIGDPSALPALQGKVNDNDVQVRIAARLAIKLLQTK
jgi:HEAT repeat protein